MDIFNTIARLFYQGGIAVMSSILMVFLLSLVIILERTYRYWLQYDLANSSAFMAAIQNMIMGESIENAIRLCQKARPKLVPTVLTEGLKRADDSPQEIEYAMESAMLEATAKVTKMVPLLGTLANVATLMGLLGTIFGLIKSFGAAATATGAQKQTLLAEGISEALTATSFGLGTALLCILAHGILSAKQTTIVNSMNLNMSKLLDILYTRKVKS